MTRVADQDWWRRISRAGTFELPAPTSTEGADTTPFVVADRWGNVVSATITLGEEFGSAVLVEEAGIWLNNSMATSTYAPAGNPMDATAGSRTHSSTSPTIIMKDGRPWAAIGSPGGHTIPQTVSIDQSIDVVETRHCPGPGHCVIAQRS